VGWGSGQLELAVASLWDCSVSWSCLWSPGSSWPSTLPAAVSGAGC